ncbi:MAG: hypothetical protein GWP74_04000, partial [Proteobacteria bacterium]|nr:hypothetical protein [Pseudomonadota bacterium]
EATDGLISLSVKGEANPVVVKVPVLGAYSKTWPLNCPKSDKIVRQVADHFAQPKAHKGFASAGMLFLLSTGEEKDLALAREWARNYRPHTYPWHIGYGGIGLAECYLRTGDKQILPHIQKLVDNAVKTEYLDGWLGRGGATPGYGNGHLNAAGTAVITFLILAKECGAKVPDETFDRVLPHFYRYAGRGGNPYGDNRTEIGFVDNGKSGNLAFAMAAGAAVMGEDSVYAGARDVCAMRSFYTTTFMLHGHTGGGIGEVWRSAAMSLLAEKKPAQYREFMDARQWHYDLSRRYNGSFGILGGSGYDKEEWGAMYPLAYTLPRKKLRIMGAPRGKFAKPVRLPKQPWGTEADNACLTLDPGLAKSGQKQDMSKEALWGDSRLHFLRRFHGKEQPSDDEVRRVVLHPDHNIRFVGAHKVLGINSGYLGKRSGGGKVREALLDELLAHPDPRVKRAMYSALLSNTGWLTQKRFDQLMATIKDPNAAWSVKDPALQLVGRVKADWIVPHVDVLLPYLEHEEWWLQNAALTALTPIVADERTYKKVLPAVGKLVAKNQRTALTRGMFSPMRGKLKGASAAVRKLAAETLKESYLGYAGVKTAPGGQNLTSTYEGHLDFIASSLAEVPGGLDILYEVGRKKNPKAILPHKEYFLKGDPSKFSPTLKKAITPVIDKELIPECVGRNHKNLTAMAAHEVKVTSTGGSRDSVDGLAALHKRAGRDEYGWHMFADWRNGEWSYHSFDPIKSARVLWERMVARYRKVTPPKGMENWYTLEF